MSAQKKFNSFQEGDMKKEIQIDRETRNPKRVKVQNQKWRERKQKFRERKKREKAERERESLNQMVESSRIR